MELCFPFLVGFFRIDLFLQTADVDPLRVTLRRTKYDLCRLNEFVELLMISNSLYCVVPRTIEFDQGVTQWRFREQRQCINLAEFFQICGQLLFSIANITL